MTLLGATAACTTGPRAEFSGPWTSRLPEGATVLFYATQVGSTIGGSISNFGPVLAGAQSAIAGTVTPQAVTLHFSYPASFVGGTPGPLVSWTFHGAFTNAATIEGTAVSATGISGTMVISKDNGPIPLYSS
jgi:hypothetical protein